MIRTDRKTGEPILSPKLTADQLHAMANDPGWRPVDAPHSRTPARMAGTHRLVAQRAEAGLRRGWSGAEASRIHAPSPPRRHTIRATAAGRRTRTGTRAGIYGICG